MEAVKPKPKLKKKATGKGKGKSKTKSDKAGTGQQTKPPEGAAVDVSNQAPNVEEASAVKSDSHSTWQDAKTDSDSIKPEAANDTEVAKETDEVEVKSKPLSLKEEDSGDKEPDSTAAASIERGIAKEADEIVKSKPLSLKEEDSQDKQPDSAAATSQISKETTQNSGTTLTGDNAIPALKQEAKDADSKLTSRGGVSTELNNEPKIEMTPTQDLENHRTTPAKPAVSIDDRPTTQLSTAGVTEEGANGTISKQTSAQKIESGTERERNVTASSQVQVAAAVVDVIPSAPALIDFSDEVQQSSQVINVQTTAAASMVSTTVASTSAEGMEDASKILYPRLDSIMQAEQEYMEEMQPFTEEDLSILYPNAQLDTQSVLVDTFIRMSDQEHHELYELLLSYLKTMQALSNSQKHIEALRSKYHTHQVLLWHAESRDITSTGRCGDGNKVTHSHNYKYATFNRESAGQVVTALKETRELLQEELCMHAYSSQLARIHVDHYLFQLMQSYPELNGTTEDAPPTSWIPNCPPGALDSHNAHLRDCISVLFMFIRKPVVNAKFSEDCRHWLDILLSALLRVATLTDHQFVFHHLLRSPPGVGKWGAPYLHLLSPLQTKQLLTAQYQNRAPPRDLNAVTTDMGYSHDWGVGLGLHSDWGGPVLDHFVTMLATLLLPIKERDSFLPEIGLQQQDLQESGPEFARSISQPWVFVEDIEEDEVDCEGNVYLLKESDFIAFFDQFPFTDLYRYILMVPLEGEFNVQSTTSYQMLRLIAFCTCLIRLLGAAFTTLKLARYKEFIKRVGRTIRLTVQYVADHWVTYKAHRLSCGDTMASLPPDVGHGDARYSLNRLQLEFDQFVLRATKWILTAHKLGAWQFLADMPYGSISLKTAWNIFWNIYCKEQGLGTTTTMMMDAAATSEDGLGGGEEAGGQRARVMSPSTVEEIQDAIRGGDFKDQFVDRLMKTYTSEAVFLLTTLVNMARARPADSEEERQFINTIVLEIFECTHVVEYARDTYSRTGSTLLDAIAIVHPFIVSTLLNRATTPTGNIRENFILLFKELPLHLWLPESHDMHVIHNMLTEYPLSSCENMLARVILSGLNWGTKSEDGSSELVLPWSMHCSVALMLVEAHTKLLPTHPGGRDYVPLASSLRNYASLHRFITSSEQQEFVTWAWEVGLMLKLHPNQLISRSMQTLSPTGEQEHEQSPPSHLAEPSWVQVNQGRDEIVLPDLTSTGERELADLRDAVKYEGLLAYYVAMCITSIGTDTDHFIASGLSMLNRLIEQGYYLPALRILANSTPQLFKHGKILVEDSNFPQIVMAIANADIANATLKERWTFATPTPLVARKMAALLQTQLQGACRPGGVGGETVLKFWLDILLSWPTWVREKSVLLLLDTLCMAAFKEPAWQKILMDRMMENYRIMDPTQPKRSLLSSVYSSVASIVGQDGGPPSIFNAVPSSECPWLAYTTLCAEQQYEEEEGIWKALLQQLRQDAKATVDTALKRAFADLKALGGFTSNHLCIYRWAEFCTELDHAHPLFPLVWQQFFMLYLQRPKLDESSMPERESFGIRFFASTRAMSIRRKMKSTLSTTGKKLQSTITDLEDGTGSGERRDLLRTFLPKLLKLCQTFRLWLEEPRLHTASLYLPGLPQQYDSDRLVTVFQADKSQLWLDFVPLWAIRSEQNKLVEEWMEVASYQKPLRSKAYPPESSPDTAVIRIQKRLSKKTTPIPPPPFRYCSAPFSLLSPDLLVSQNSLLGLVHADIEYLKLQAKSFCTKVEALTTLDNTYESAIPHLYTNEVRQFHVRVPCRPGRFSKVHQCQDPAIIVFRFDEMTVNPRWDQQIKVNRVEYDSMMQALCNPISKDLCPIILRLEHTVAELSKLSDQNQGAQINVPLQCGIALFYKIMEFISQEIRQFPPTCQILTTCLQLLGQEFVGRDPLQTTNLLDLLLTQHGKSDLIVPLFQPNLCPEQFLHMYGSAAEICVKEGPSIAFSVLTKFNIVEWLESYDPSMGERTQLLEFINQGLTLYGKQATRESEMLVEVYRQHFVQLVEYKFPDLYSDALQMLINGTDNANVILTSWSDLCKIVCSDTSPDSCKLGLQQAGESLQLLATHYLELRYASEQTLYSLLSKEYIPLIGKFIELLCIAVATKWKKAIAEDTAKPSEAITSCWQSILDVFTPWIKPLQSSGGASFPGGSLPPCLDSEVGLLKTIMALFVNSISKAHSHLQDPLQNVSIMGLLWAHYCSSLAQSSTPRYLLSAYHSTLEELPWSLFFPDLASMDSMMKLRLMDNLSSFAFLGKIFPLFDWKTIAATYSDINRHSDSSLSVQFHIMFLQVLLMLAAEKQVMDREGTGIPGVIAEAQSFHWEFIDAKTYQDILNWQKSHCDPTSILQTGSCLSLALRLLKAVAGFPTSSGPREVLHSDTWEKRLAYLQVTVELIALSSEKQSTHNKSYAQPVSHLFETAVDIAMHEPSEIGGSNMLSTIQEILNLLNICSPAGGMIMNIINIIFDIMDQMAGVPILALSIITAGCKVLASLHTMVVVVEHTINCYFSNDLAPPQSTTLELPPDPVNGYGWKYITNSLSLPVDSTDEIYKNCISECAVLIMHTQLMQELPCCTSTPQEFRIAIKVVQWCTQLKLPPTAEAKIFLLWEKALSLLLRQARFVGNHYELVPHFTALATSMIRFGEDKATDGILGVIGLGKKTCYSHRFRLVSRAVAAFLHCQMPVDGKQTTLLRVIPNAPGHVKDLPRQQSPTGIGATKQGNQTCAALEALLTDKHYTLLREHATYAVNFVNNPSNCIANCNYLLVYLSTILYPESRYLDLLRVLSI